MSIGPEQLIVLGFDHPNFQGEVKAELQRLHDNDAIRVIDALAVFKDAQGEIEIEHLSNMSRDEAIELGSVVGALAAVVVAGGAGRAGGAAAGRGGWPGGTWPNPGPSPPSSSAARG